MIKASDIIARGFHKAFCELCQRETWHYKAADNQPATCSDHSKYDPKRKHAIVGNVMVANLSRNQHVAPTEREIRIANRMDRSLWRTAEDRKTRVYIDDEEWANSLFEDMPNAPDPDKLYCSFCGNEVEQVNVLSEKKPKIKRVTNHYRDSSGQIHIEEKVVTQVETVHACPHCVLNVRKAIVVRTV